MTGVQTCALPIWIASGPGFCRLRPQPHSTRRSARRRPSITDPRVRVTDLRFYSRGIGSGDGVQPNVTFALTGAIKPDENSPDVTFTIEGAATQRLIDL